MQALVYDDVSKSLNVQEDYPKPVAGPKEALIKVHRTGICSTDIEITRGYVPGYNQPLGHEFVGSVVECSEQPELVGQRVVGEININCQGFTCGNAIFQRNHAPGRQVLGIINRPGCCSQYITLPAANLHPVPASLSDAQAAFCEPLAAACRVLEQGLLDSSSSSSSSSQRVAVVGDGRLGLLIAQVCALHAPGRVTHFGRHPEKMSLVTGTVAQVVVDDDTAAAYAGQFDLVVEASGSASSVRTALQLTKPMGVLVLKTTVSLQDPHMPGWSELANDIVVQEKTLVGSRCGPMAMALELMVQHEELRRLLGAMLQHEVPLSAGVSAMNLASSKGVLKVQLVMDTSGGTGCA